MKDTRKDTRQVLRGISLVENDKHRVVTDPDEVSTMYSQGELDAFVESGVLFGEPWKSTKPEEKPEKEEEKAKK